MLPAAVTQSTIRALDWLAAKFLPADPAAPHIATGRRGEEDAYFYLRRHGYTIIARNYRSPNHHGELDLVGYHKDTLCFIEVKSRTTRAIKPAEAAVDREKQDDLRHVARDFLGRLPTRPSCRFDVLAVYYDRDPRDPTFELFQNAFPMAYNRELARSY
ncbi:MAG TPA: YraN family protein [Terriglobales bacterium]|nr:YraN family protein [Terriglobales bacterium]